MSRLALIVLIIGIVHRANGQVCTWTWVTPAADTTAQTISIDAPLTLSASITGTTLATGHEISLKSGTTVLVTGTATVAGDGTVTWAYSPNVVTAAFTETGALNGKTYTITIPKNNILATHAGDLTIENGACTSGGATSAITLTVQSCNLAVYGDQASAAVTTDCNNECAREFTCTHDTTETFTSTCAADASWSQKYAPCPCAASAGVKEVALLALVMLCSSLSATHLM